MSDLSKTLKELMQIFAGLDKHKTSAYDTTATVLRVEGDIAWVHLPGGVMETPVSKTINCRPGDNVQVRVSNGRAWLQGNVTAPPTDDREASEAKKQAGEAYYVAEEARNSIAAAYEAAERAEAEAGRASTAAIAATDSAGRAIQSAKSALGSANAALTQLGIVEDVVGVLEKIQKDGEYRVTEDMIPVGGKWYFTRSGTPPNYTYAVVTNPTSIEYALTTDATIVPGKVYYTRSGSGTSSDPYVYTRVDNPDASEISTYYECIYYELVSVESSIQDYITSHVSVTSQGMYLQTDGVASKILVSPQDGIVLIGADGQPIAKYGSETVIGNTASYHIKINPGTSGGKMSFMNGPNNEIAWMSGQELHIPHVVVVNSMQAGNWLWDAGTSDNHLTLKWNE